MCIYYQLSIFPLIYNYLCWGKKVNNNTKEIEENKTQHLYVFVHDFAEETFFFVMMCSKVVGVEENEMFPPRFCLDKMFKFTFIS